MELAIGLCFPLKLASMYLDLECSVHIEMITNRVDYTFFLSGFHISGPSIFSLCSN